ncbi:hypothetical protein XU18_1036 [Perkinsela sp. CCAP 1560/4]|nr:hypothetical protein XU18_1036 [Perkinsela sp. CCAP 1560/4]|eukprot:KNH08467.1 hypothetical protein XU18_1036 [Perkinsela sp. CCAP 1560/4]
MKDDKISLHEDPDADAWIYVPEAKYMIIKDVTTVQQNSDCDFGHITESHLGGYPFWMLSESGHSSTKSNPSTLCSSCPKCANSEPLTLIAQLYVPLEGVDRVTYVFGCNTYKCTYFCAYRYSNHASLAQKGLLKESNLFSMDENWGISEELSEDKLVQTSLPPQTLLDTNRPCLPFTSLIQQREVDAYDSYLSHVRQESEKLVESSLPSEVQNSEFDTSGQMEEIPEDEILQEYLQSSQIYPNRIAKWCPNRPPVLICASQDVHDFPSNKADSTFIKLPEEKQEYLSGQMNLSTRVPSCETCGSPRHFEFQIFSTAVYLLGSGYGDWYMNDNMASMGTLIVFSCLNPKCGNGEYVSEYIAYQGGV